MSEVHVDVEPWPLYSDTGGAPSWRVRITSPKGVASLLWSTRFNRFSRAWDTMNLRRGNPSAYRISVDFMRKFCASVDAQKRDKCRPETGQKTEETGQTKTGHFSRAPAEPSAIVPFVPWDTLGRDRDSSVGQGQSSAPLRDRPHPTAAPVVSREEYRRRLAADPRFSGWVAGSAE